MHIFRLAEPGVPDKRSPFHYLLWLASGQAWPLVCSATFGILWMLSNALMPVAIGMVIDSIFGAASSSGRSASQVSAWLLLLGLGAAQAVTNVGRHRFSNENARTASFRTVQVVARHAVNVGAALSQANHGDAVSISAVDVANIGEVMMVVGRAAGALVSFLVVALIAMHISVSLGGAVLIGAPLLAVAVGPMIRPLYRRQTELRKIISRLSVSTIDLVNGLRVIRGIRVEEEFAARYWARSEEARLAGIRLGRVESSLDAAKSFLPACLIVFAICLGAHLVEVSFVSPGALVTLYGFAAFLSTPLYTATEFAEKVSRGLMSARHVVNLLETERDPALKGGTQQLPRRSPPVELVDAASGLTIGSGVLTVVTASTLDESRHLAATLGRFAAGAWSFRGVSVDQLCLFEYRQAVLVVDPDSPLFAGRLRDELDPMSQCSAAEIESALHTACASEIVDALPGRLASSVGPRGYTFSGGERQRLVLARALLANPDVLVLCEPTGTLDPLTEATVVRRLAASRANRTTVIITQNPFLSAIADRGT